MAEEKTYVFDSNSRPYGDYGWGGGFNGLGGWGGGIIGFILGALCNGGLFGNGLFGGGYGGGAGIGYLGNQMNNDNNTDLIMNAINGTDADVRLLASTLNADVNEVKSAISTVQNGLTSIVGQTGLGFQQVVNAIQSGNASLQSKLCECCCENRLLTTQQGYESQIRTLEQTNQLGAQADRNTNSIISAISAQTVAMNDGFCAIKERELQDKIDTLLAQNTTLRSQIDNANQTATFAAMLAPINAKLVEIESRQPATVPVVYPNLIATPVTPTTTTGA